MATVTFYNVHHEEAMGVLIVVYFFLSGLGAGTFLTAAACRIFGGERFAKIERAAAIAVPILLAPGLLCLLIDLGKPLRFFNLFLYFNPRSIASWGVWLMNVFMGISVVYAYLHLKGKLAKAKPLACVGGVLAVMVGLYSGMLLYQMRGHELWHSALVPVIFLASAVASGLAVVLLLSAKADSQQTHVLATALAVAVGVDLVLALTEVVALGWASGTDAETGSLILSGGFGALFLGVYLVLGLGAPLAILIWQRAKRSVQISAAVLVLIGTLAMRYVIVMGGQTLPLS